MLRYRPQEQVNASGKVTDISPSTSISPRLTGLLRKSLNQMIVGPAKWHGRPVATQFVVNLKLDMSARSDGAYEATIGYVSSSPVPSGQWHWFNDRQSGRLALVDNSYDQLPARREPNWRYVDPPPRPGHHSGNSGGQSAPPPSPPSQSASMGAMRTFQRAPSPRAQRGR